MFYIRKAHPKLNVLVINLDKYFNPEDKEASFSEISLSTQYKNPEDHGQNFLKVHYKEFYPNRPHHVGCYLLDNAHTGKEKVTDWF
jgi:hypothetical protein